MIYIFILIFVLSFLIAWRSMEEFYPSKETKEIFKNRRFLGSVIFLKKGIRHYSSSSSSFSSTSNERK